ncbi:hypothetical protein EAF00_010939 [Botryotinia globosa]|nr:hypothetical protein EAF00_010939 [Botryotinia globosa]
MLVDDVETVLRTYPPLLRRVRDVSIHIGFPTHKTEGSINERQRKLEVHLHANNSSSEDLEALMPIFHMNVALKTLLEVGYKERATFTIGGRDHEGHQMDDRDDGRDRLIGGHLVNGRDEVLWIRGREWEQAVHSGC